MKLPLNTVRRYYNQKEKSHLERLGFKFIHIETPPGWEDDDSQWLKDTENLPEIQIDTLEELSQIMKNYGEVIISLHHLTIYDGCIE